MMFSACNSQLPAQFVVYLVAMSLAVMFNFPESFEFNCHLSKTNKTS